MTVIEIEAPVEPAMTDKLVFDAPFGIAGRIVERLVLRGYVRNFGANLLQ